MQLTSEQYAGYVLSRAAEAVAKHGANRKISAIYEVYQTAPCPLAEAVAAVEAVLAGK